LARPWLSNRFPRGKIQNYSDRSVVGSIQHHGHTWSSRVFAYSLCPSGFPERPSPYDVSAIGRVPRPKRSIFPEAAHAPETKMSPLIVASALLVVSALLLPKVF